MAFRNQGGKKESKQEEREKCPGNERHVNEGRSREQWGRGRARNSEMPNELDLKQH